MKVNTLYLPLFCVVLLVCWSCNTHDPLPPGVVDAGLSFNDDKTFRIAQFTDLHWQHGADNSTVTAETIRMVLTEEQPDLVILTGDVVTYDPEKEGWLDVADVLAASGIPWTVTLGNHDDEREMSREDIFVLLAKQPGFIGIAGPDVTGTGNYVINLRSSSGEKTAALVYCFDSQAYTDDHRHGSTAWISFDQIAWYRHISQSYTEKNDGMPVPALAFFHIPLPEHNLITKQGPFAAEGGGRAQHRINSGLFASLVEMQDVMGVFAGHIHSRNQVGIVNTIALGYGQVTGANAVGSLERGGRIVELVEGVRGFNTWIRTASGTSGHYNYPFGESFLEDDLSFISPVDVPNAVQGLLYTYFEGSFKSVHDMKDQHIVKEGVVSKISLDEALADDHFGFAFTGLIRIPEKGLYRFYTYSDDGSRLFVGGVEVVDNDGSRSAQRAEGVIALHEGYHDFALLYFEDYMGEHLEVGISSLHMQEILLPDTMLFYK